MRIKRVHKEKSKTIKKFFPAFPVEVLALQQFFEEMSDKGYMIIGNNGAFYEFKECEPKKRRFQVDYFLKASVFDSKPEIKTREYMNYCKEAGWIYCFSSGKMQCFYTEDMEIPPIETDDALRFKTIVKAEIPNRMLQLFTAILFAWVGITLWFRAIYHYREWMYFFTSSFSLGLVFVFSAYIIMAVIGFSSFLLFYFKNKKRLKYGQALSLCLPKQAVRHMKIRMMAVGILSLYVGLITIQETFQLIIFLFAILLIVGITAVQGRFMKSKNSNRTTNIVFIIVICFVVLQLSNVFIIGGIMLSPVTDDSIDSYQSDQIPVELKDLGYRLDNKVEDEETIAEVEKTFFAKKTYYFDRYITKEENNNTGSEADNRDPFFAITVFESRLSWVTNRYSELIIDESEVELIPEKEYPEIFKQGYEAYLMEDEDQKTNLMLRKEGKTICIRSHEQLTQENVLLILDHL